MKPLSLLVVFTIASNAFGNEAPPSSPAMRSDFPIPDSPFQPDLTPGYALIEGDMQVPIEQYRMIVDGGIQPAGTFGLATYWNTHVVPYDFVTTGNGAVSAANQTAAIGAMTAIAARAHLIFRPALPSEPDRIRFQNSGFNNSPVGFQGGAQIINIASWGNQITICHEIYHSLGFRHEQSRLDRGNYVTINAENICGSGNSTACTAGTGAGQCCLCMDTAGNCTSCAFNFSFAGLSSTYGPYDFDSFMHYGRADFSCNGADTITVKEPWNAYWQNKIGQSSHFSYFDTITCRALYPFPTDRWLDRTYDGTSVGSFGQPYNDTSLTDAVAGVPGGGTLFIKHGNTYSAVGTYRSPVTIIAPNGSVFLGQ